MAMEGLRKELAEVNAKSQAAAKRKMAGVPPLSKAELLKVREPDARPQWVWRDGGGRTHLVGVTELCRMIGTDPNLALSVLHGSGSREAGRSAGGMDLQRKGWVRVQDRAGETSSNSTSSGERTPPPKAPKTQTPPKGPREKIALRE